MYSLALAFVMILEKGFEARHEFGGFGPAVVHLFQQADVHHVWANSICLSGSLLGYNMLSTIRRNLGEGTLLRIFFQNPPMNS
jgi:hypothetical protein